MRKISFLNRGLLLVLLSCAVGLAGCSQQTPGELAGVWRSDDAVAGKNLVLEFVPDGSGKVFSGSIIGFPTDTSFEWERQGDEVTIETDGDEPITQVMTILSQEEDSVSVEVNRTQLTLIRIEEDISDDLEDVNF